MTFSAAKIGAEKAPPTAAAQTVEVKALRETSIVISL
jgi:hypothetical protein